MHRASLNASRSLFSTLSSFCTQPSPFFPPHRSYSINMVNGRVVSQSNGESTAAAANGPMLQRIHAAKLLKEKVSAMLQDAVNINSQAKALRSQAAYARQQADDVKAEENALRSKIMDVSSDLKVCLITLRLQSFSHRSPSCFSRPNTRQSMRCPAKLTGWLPTANGLPSRALLI